MIDRGLTLGPYFKKLFFKIFKKIVITLTIWYQKSIWLWCIQQIN